MPRMPPRPGPRKSIAGTPNPGDDGPTAAERLSYYDLPRPFKSPHFHSRLNTRTASGSTTAVKKNAKQILTLERERYGGGDGFLSAAQTLAKARGEPIDMGGKKKKANPIGVPGGRTRVLSGAAGAAARAKASRNNSAAVSRASPEEEDEDVDMEDAGENGAAAGQPVPEPGGGPAPADTGAPRKEVFTYHTPTAPPSLLPPKKYCDITGLHAAYTDPRTKLRYKGLDVWHIVRGLGPGADQAYLAVRGAQTSLK